MAFWNKKVASPTSQTNGVAVVPDTISGLVPPGSIQMAGYQNTGRYNNPNVFSLPQTKLVPQFNKMLGTGIASVVPVILKRQGN